MTGYVKSELGDFLLLNLSDFDKERMKALEDPMRSMYLAKETGTCWTLFIDGKIAGIAGCIPLRKGVIEVFTITDVMIKKHAKTVIKYGREFIRKVTEAYEAHRVQSSVHVDDKRSIRWNKALGLEIEARLSKYAEDGADHYMCVKVVQ